MEEQNAKRKNKVIFVYIYCFAFIAILFGIRIYQFENAEFKLETANYSYYHKPSSQLLININTADLQQLCELPQIGEALAQRIITYREQNSKFYSVEDIMSVKGIGQAKFEAIEKLITV